MSEDHLLVLGAGPGGYTAAFYAADQGYKVTLVDAADKPGGVCLHRGCIPSKALLHVADFLGEARQAGEWGLSFNDPQINLERLREWKDGIVAKMSGGLVTLCKQRGVNYINQRGSFVNSNTVKFEGGESVNFDKCILATGSQPVVPDSFLHAGSLVMDSTTALDIADIPERLLIIGGGYIGLEMGSVYCALGSRITVVEMTEGLLPGVDRDLVRPLQAKLKNEFKSFRFNTKVVSVSQKGQSLVVIMESGDEKFEETFDRVLVSVGRRPNTSGIGLENTSLEMDEKGFVKVDPKRQTSDSSILAIGDVTGEPMLAHKASHEARVAIEGLSGKDISFTDRVIPAVVFTDPEIAWCGLTESEAKNMNCDVTIAKFPWVASGRAHTLGRAEGMSKLILGKETGRVLGVGIVGHGAGELIAEGVLAINMGSKAEDLANCIHPHPTLSETLMESAEVFLGTATHIYKRPRK